MSQWAQTCAVKWHTAREKFPLGSAAVPEHAVLRNRAAVAEELRRLLPRMEGSCQKGKTLPFGLPAIDRHLPQGGLPCGALHEIVPEPGGTPAAFGFIVALLATILPRKAGEDETYLGAGLPRTYPPLIFVLPDYGQYGRLYGHGLNALGLDPARVILVKAMHRRDALWAMEEALRSGAPAAVAGVIDKLHLKSSQRLQFAAAQAGLPLFLLRQAPSPSSPACGGGWGGGSAAATRWRVAPARAARDRFSLFARARWHLLLERCRNGRAGEWMVEYDHVAHRFSLATALADPALSHGASAGENPEQYGGKAHRS